MLSGLFFAVVRLSWEAKGLSSLPGGGQVDGLPPAASDREKVVRSIPLCLLRTEVIRINRPSTGRQLRNYSEISGRFFEKVEFFWH